MELTGDLMSESRMAKSKLVSLRQPVGIQGLPAQQIGAKSSADTACTASSTHAPSDGTSQFGPTRKIPFNQNVYSNGNSNYMHMNDKRESANLQSQQAQFHGDNILSKQQRNSSSPT